jgi:hypothetical protein
LVLLVVNVLGIHAAGTYNGVGLGVRATLLSMARQGRGQ